jgi:hypothetical protein
MWEWWDSLESVTRFRWWMGFLAISFAGLSALSGGFRWLADNRRDYLKTQQEQKLADPWRLSPQQREQFVAILREAPSRIELDVAIGEPYTQNFAAELIILFTDAGWSTHFTSTHRFIDRPLYGIKLELNLYTVSNEDQEMGALERSIIEGAFNTVGIRLENTEVHREISPEPRKLIKLYIGHRPLPPT